MVRKSIFLLPLIIFFVMAANTVIAQKECAQNGNMPVCAYEALNVGKLKLTIDGKLDDWKSIKGIFLGKDFWEARAEDYKGEDDLSATWWVTWDEGNLYVALSVKDDVHQNTHKDAIFVGDCVQFSIDPTGMKVTYAGNVYEYGYALAGPEGSEKPSVLRVFTNPASEGETSKYAILRDEAKKTTTYEIQIPEGDIALAELSAGKKIGWAIAVIDSDTCNCQGGWVGWASSALSKRAEPMADLIFSAGVITAVKPAGKLAITWGDMKTRL